MTSFDWHSQKSMSTSQLHFSLLNQTHAYIANVDAQVAKMYLENKPEFDRTAKSWVEQYASPKSDASKEEAVGRVCEMGFDKESARNALEKHKWDEQAAVNDLLGM